MSFPTSVKCSSARPKHNAGPLRVVTLASRQTLRFGSGHVGPVTCLRMTIPDLSLTFRRVAASASIIKPSSNPMNLSKTWCHRGPCVLCQFSEAIGRDCWDSQTFEVYHMKLEQLEVRYGSIVSMSCRFIVLLRRE